MMDWSQKTYKDSLKKKSVSIWLMVVFYLLFTGLGAPVILDLTTAWYTTFMFYSTFFVLFVAIAASIGNYKWTFYVFTFLVVLPHILFMFYLKEPPLLFPLLAFLIGVILFYNTHTAEK